MTTPDMDAALAALHTRTTEKLATIPRPVGWTLAAHLDAWDDGDDGTDDPFPSPSHPLLRVEAEAGMQVADRPGPVSGHRVTLDPFMLGRAYPEAFDAVVVGAARACLLGLMDELATQIVRGTR